MTTPLDLSRLWVQAKRNREIRRQCHRCDDIEIGVHRSAWIAHQKSAHPDLEFEEYISMTTDKKKLDKVITEEAPDPPPPHKDIPQLPQERSKASTTLFPPHAPPPIIHPDNFSRNLPPSSTEAIDEGRLNTRESSSSKKATATTIAENKVANKTNRNNNPNHTSVNPNMPSPSQPQRQPSPQQDRTVVPQTGAMIRQPETRPISQEQLVAEVKGIYAGLVMVESKCIEVDNGQTQRPNQILTHEQWQALIALHRTLLHEHHDFFLASQHPSASPALRRLASKYAMPARMWRHGIHSFLELLRRRLPHSLEHMLTFIYLAYSMMALLYETVPAFADTWIECLGDLGRYRMAIEDDDRRDREVWTGVSRHWYSMASDNAPTTGRLYHHLAILARPNALQQLFYYCKSLCVAVPFESAKESILILFDPVLNQEGGRTLAMSPTDLTFVRLIGILFTHRSVEKLNPSIEEWIGSLEANIARSNRRFQEAGYYISIVLSCALMGFGLGEKDDRPDNVLHKLLQEPDSDSPMVDISAPSSFFTQSRDLFSKALDVILSRHSDVNILHFSHCTMVFLLHICAYPAALQAIAPALPWSRFARLLNTLLLESPDRDLSRFAGNTIPSPEKQHSPSPLPEDYAMRGLSWTKNYYPNSFFAEQVDDEDKYFEVPSMTEHRKDRILSLGFRIARVADYLLYDEAGRRFVSNPRHSLEEEAQGYSHIPLGVESKSLSEADTDTDVSALSSAGLATPSSSEDEMVTDIADE